MALLSTQNIDNAGLEATYGPASALGDTIANDGKTMLHVKNGSGGSITVTVAATVACNHGTLHDVAVVVPAGKERMIGPFPVSRFGDSPEISYSGVTSLTIAAIRLPTA